MKYFYIFIIFVLGFALGRMSAPQSEKDLPVAEIATASDTNPVATEKGSKPVEDKISPQDKLPPTHLGRFERTENSARDKKMQELYEELMEAGKRADIQEQNALLAAMEKLNPKHEKVYRAKAEFLQEDEDWEGAHKVLEDCIANVPNSVYCLRRLTNIRSSTEEDKIRYGTECLQIAKNDPLCLVDLAIALNSKGEFAKAKDYFEQALNLPQRSDGFHREYILYQYARTLESLNLHQKAREAFAESCKLGNSSACAKIKT